MLYKFKEQHYENVSVGGSIESRSTGDEITLKTANGEILLSSGFVPRWRIGELIVGFRGSEVILLGKEIHSIGSIDVPDEKIDCLAYAGRFTMNGKEMEGRRIILSHLGVDLVDVLYTDRADISDILERVKNGEQGIQ